MKKLIPLLLLVLACGYFAIAHAAPQANGTCSLSADQINAELKRDGVQKTYDDLAKDGRWDVLIKCIDTGDTAWVEIDVVLSAVGDASGGEELNTALSEAFASQPRTVLKFLHDKYHFEVNLDVVCSAPDIDDPRYNSYELAITAINKREHAIANITDKELLDDVASCHDALEYARKWVAYTYGHGPNPDQAPPATTH